jgi:hypothetical protein
MTSNPRNCPRSLTQLIRVLQPILALTTAIWHNDHTAQPVKRSLTAYDHSAPRCALSYSRFSLRGTWREVSGSDGLPGAER